MSTQMNQNNNGIQVNKKTLNKREKNGYSKK